MSEIEKLRARIVKLEAVAKSIEIKGPDGDGLVWARFRIGNGHGAVNLGLPLRIVAQVALIFEQDRRAALAHLDADDHPATAEADAVERRAERFAREG